MTAEGGFGFVELLNLEVGWGESGALCLPGRTRRGPERSSR